MRAPAPPVAAAAAKAAVAMGGEAGAVGLKPIPGRCDGDPWAHIIGAVVGVALSVGRRVRQRHIQRQLELCNHRHRGHIW